MRNSKLEAIDVRFVNAVGELERWRLLKLTSLRENRSDVHVRVDNGTGGGVSMSADQKSKER